jgi:glycosyltransferase involved in cell wall biosynthesis
VYRGIPFTRVRSLLNLITDLPSLLIRKKADTPKAVKIDYDDSKEVTNQVTGKVGAAMILRYQLFYFNCLIYLWLRRKQFDIIHVHMMEWPAFVAVRIGRLLNKPVVIKDSTMNGIFNILRYPGGAKKQKDIARYAHCVAMTCMIKENYLKAGVPSDHITTIPNGIHIEPRPDTNKVWGQRVIFVGNLTQQPAKGIDILLNAWRTVVEQYSKATLQIVGSGDLHTYRAYADAKGIGSSVNFMGRQQNVRQLLLDADIFVLPSRREGMSNALMEAMMCSMPVVATNVSGSQDLITHNESGLLVPSADSSKLSEAIITMLRDPERAIAMGKKAYESVKEKCNMETVALKYIGLYNQILERD